MIKYSLILPLSFNEWYIIFVIAIVCIIILHNSRGRVYDIICSNILSVLRIKLSIINGWDETLANNLLHILPKSPQFVRIVKLRCLVPHGEILKESAPFIHIKGCCLQTLKGTQLRGEHRANYSFAFY
jgi:hypothetical protein